MAIQTKSNGISFAGLLFLIFLVLKLTKNIDWSWWWVTCPLWIGGAVVFGFAVIMLFIGIIIKLLSLIFGRKILNNRIHNRINNKK